MPCATLPWVPAYVRMAPKIGPIHGVHPAPNATPTKMLPKYPSGLF